MTSPMNKHNLDGGHEAESSSLTGGQKPVCLSALHYWMFLSMHVCTNLRHIPRWCINPEKSHHKAMISTPHTRFIHLAFLWYFKPDRLTACLSVKLSIYWKTNLNFKNASRSLLNMGSCLLISFIKFSCGILSAHCMEACSDIRGLHLKIYD